MTMQAPQIVSGDSVRSEAYGFIWYCVPKVASRSLLALLATESAGGIRFKDTPTPKAVSLPEGKKLDDYFKFAFVRDPIDRILSAYVDKIAHYDDSVGKRAMMKKHKGLRPFMPFNAFLDWLEGPEGGNDGFADPHFRSQHAFVFDGAGRLAVDFVGRMETLDDDFRTVCRKVGLPEAELPRLNTNHGRIGGHAAPPDYYRTLVNAGDVARLRRRYARDMQSFGY